MMYVIFIAVAVISLGFGIYIGGKYASNATAQLLSDVMMDLAPDMIPQFNEELQVRMSEKRFKRL